MILRFTYAGLAIILICMIAVSCQSPEQETNKTTWAIERKLSTPHYKQEIQPIFNRRCVACHGCIGSPCNLKLDSFRAADRGAMVRNPYSTHFETYLRTGMDVVQTIDEWRSRGFFPVISRTGTAQQNLEQSLLYHMLLAGTRWNQPGFSLSALESTYQHRFAHQCPSTTSSLLEYLKKNPSAGMPYGLPAIGDADFNTLKNWIAAGAPGPTEQDIQDTLQIDDPQAVYQWERFFNNPDKRYQLVMRYLFDHTFLAHIVLEESPDDFFRLVRSKTPPAENNKDLENSIVFETNPVDIIDTPLPYDNPYTYAGVEKFYYRLKKITTPIVQKSHFVWTLKLDDIEYLKELFFARGWDPKADLNPPWGIGNPFRIFRAIPTDIRSRFMLENSELIVSAITYGPVCLGQTATYAVKDQFWVFFVDPAHDATVLEPDLGLNTWNLFMDKSQLGNNEYEDAYAKALARIQPEGYSLEAIWNGTQTNKNAWLTVLRHDTNTSVMKGGKGGIPRTFWLVDYGGFERIYYDTVADFKYWSGDAEKLKTLIFFDNLREEFQDNFLLLLPANQREKIRHKWTQGIGSVALYAMPFAGKDQPTQIETGGPHPLLNLIGLIRDSMGPKISGLPDKLNPLEKPNIPVGEPIDSYENWTRAVSNLTVSKNYQFPRFLPSVTLLRLDNGIESKVYSLIANRVYASQDTLIFQNSTALPDENTMSVYPTLIGGFPNLFIQLDINQTTEFLEELKGIKSLEDWNQFKYKYATLRNDEDFWSIYDWFNQWNFQNRGIHAGILDLSYYNISDSGY